MSKPGSNWRGEAGGTCGHTWDKTVRIKGTLPNGFGDHHWVDSQPLDDVHILAGKSTIPSNRGAPDYDYEQLGIGWGAKKEEETVAALQAYIDLFRGQLGTAPLTVKQRNMVEVGLRNAEVNIDAALAIHKLWDDREGGTWPLWFSDRVTNFYAAKNPKGCAYGKVVIGAGRGSPPVRCPSQSELKQRAKDRATIKKRLVDAVYWIRCSQWGMGRMILYWAAKQEWDKRPGSGAPGGLAPRPPGTVPPGFPGPDGIKQQPGGGDPLPPGFAVEPPKPPPPEGPWIHYPPDPPDVIDPEDVPEPEDPDIPPDAGPGPELPANGEPAPTKPSTGKAAFIAVAGVGLLWWMSKQ